MRACVRTCECTHAREYVRQTIARGRRAVVDAVASVIVLFHLSVFRREKTIEAEIEIKTETERERIYIYTYIHTLVMEERMIACISHGEEKETTITRKREEIANGRREP